MIDTLCENPETGITLIVPEQFSFSAEKNLLTVTGERKAVNTEVHSFTSLAEKVIGKPAFYERRRLSESSAAVLMSMALNEKKPELRLYGKHADRISTVREFMSLSSEFKQSNVSNEQIKNLISGLDESVLKMKLTEIVSVLECFDAKVSESYFDPDTLLTAVLGSASLDAYLNGRTVFIDSFRGFTAQEYEIIRRIMIRAENVYITLLSDNPAQSVRIGDVFAKTGNTASRIMNIAKETGTEVAAPVILKADAFERYKNAELAFLEKELFSESGAVYEEKCENISLCKAADIYTECEYVAAQIKKLIRENGYRNRDIAVISRKIDVYESPLRSALKKNGIPVYEDYRKPVDTSPVINIISAALSAIKTGYDTDSVLRYLKTGISGLSDYEVTLVENYCYVWQISGSKWKTEWTANPDGIEKTDESNREIIEKKLAKLNEIRHKILDPFEEFRNTVKGGTDGSSAVGALWKFIEKINLSYNVTSLAEKLHNDGESNAVIELQRMWDTLISILDEMETVLRDKKVTLSVFSDYFEMMLSCQTVGNIPQGLDEVVIGSADRIRLNSPRAAFIMGANEGVFPPEMKITSSLTAKEREELRNLGISLSETGEWKLAEEQLIIYSSVCCPKEKLFITCSCSGPDGREMLPCNFWYGIKKLFPSLREKDASDLDPLFYIEGDEPAFEQFAKSGNSELRETLKKYFSEKPGYSDRLNALDRAAHLRQFELTGKETAEKLFGKSMQLSATKIEKFYGCPFSYFCKYGLKAKPRAKADFDNLQRGNITHYVMEHLLSAYSREELSAMSEEELRKAVFELADKCRTDLFSEYSDNSRFIYLFDVLKNSLLEVAKRLIEEFSHCDFIPVGFEVEIGEGKEVNTYIPENGNGEIGIIGKIDRVDIAEKDGRKYLRIIDYKSSQKEFRLSDVVHGINMQMLIYLFTLWVNGSKKYGDGMVPSGVLYYNAANAVVSADLIYNPETINEKKKKKQKMTGIVLKNAEIIEMMEHDAGGNYIPAGIDKDGKITGEAIDLEALGLLKKKCDLIILEMAKLLSQGCIEALPTERDSAVHHRCDYCDYRTVCSYEEDIERHTYLNKKTEEEIEILKEGAEDNGNTVE